MMLQVIIINWYSPYSLHFQMRCSKLIERDSSFDFSFRCYTGSNIGNNHKTNDSDTWNMYRTIRSSSLMSPQFQYVKPVSSQWMRSLLSNTFCNIPVPYADRKIGINLCIFFSCVSLWVMQCMSLCPPAPMFMCLTPISQTRPLNLLAALMGEIVISQLTFNNIWEQEAHLLSLFVLPD